MGTTAHKPDRFELAKRARTQQHFSDELETKMMLIDRVTALTGIEVVERGNDELPCQFDALLKRDSSKRLRKKESALFCKLRHDGITIYGLDQSATYQIVSRGWGKLLLDGVILFLPRNNLELDIVWTLVQRAYNNLLHPSARNPGRHIVSTWDLPRFSRTTLH